LLFNLTVHFTRASGSPYLSRLLFFDLLFPSSSNNNKAPCLVPGGFLSSLFWLYLAVFGLVLVLLTSVLRHFNFIVGSLD